MDQQVSTTSSVPRSSPKDVFYHLLAIVTLYMSAISFITLLFQLINTWFPDRLNGQDFGINEAIRWSAAVLIVAFPVYLLMMWLINKDLAQNPQRRELRVRKWLGYLTLFIAAITAIVDIATLVYNLLGGELTIRFVLKVLVVLIVSAVIFFYYLKEMRAKQEALT